MQFTVGQRLHGFTITQIRSFPEGEGQLLEMVYDKTGTELVWHRSQEQNKLFCVGFKTLPEDSTGVFHILEHSVLCGSAKYPVKEPFVELLKSSMNTFLNAMTFPDKTIYPVSSRSKQDFLNLTGVYMDAVFAPRILTDANIFYQEGWHYEVEEGQLKYKGVVFNEMKGAMSAVDRVVSSTVQQALFPDNCYGFNSGGDPKVIPQLTYEQFIETYKRNYHPTNARVYMDGDVPVEEVLQILDSYFSAFEMGQKQHIQPQQIISREITTYYEAPDADQPNKAHLAFGKIFAKFDDNVKILAAEVLSDILVGSNAAVLKKAILSAGIAQNVTLRITDGVAQPWFTLHLQNMDANRDQEALDLIRSTVSQLVETGIDKEELIASINRMAFRIKQAQEPQGLIRCMSAMDSWLYEGDPMLYLFYDDAIAQLRTMCEDGSFDQLLQQLLLEEEGRCLVRVLPSATYGEECRKEEDGRLQAHYAALNQQQRQQLQDAHQALVAWQQKPDSPEQLATLPVLDLSQIGPEPQFTATEECQVNGVTVLRHKVSSNGIVHLSMYFSLADRTLEELCQLSLLGTLLGKLPTAKHDVLQLQNIIKRDIGSLTFGLDVHAKENCSTECTPHLCVRCSVLKENLAAAEDLLLEILTSTDFHHPDLIRQSLTQSDMDSQKMGVMAGHQLAVTCVNAHYSAAGAVNDCISGYSRTQFLHQFVKNFDNEVEPYITFIEETLRQCVCVERLTVSVTEDGYCCANSLIERIPHGDGCATTATYETALPTKLGIRIPAQISFAIQGYHLNQQQREYHGHLRLLTKIVSLSYLWNTVRVQGGAYGAGIQAGRSGSMMTYSYRDPSPARSLEAYSGISRFIREFCQSEEPLDKFIISTIGGMEPLLSANQEARLADDRWFAGQSYADARRERQQILQAKKEDLLNWCDVLDHFAQKGAVCVVGYAEALNTCGEDMTILDL